MKTITLNIEDIIKAYQALTHLLASTGISRKQVYWLSRNQSKLQVHVKNWYENNVKQIFDKHAIEIPSQPFIPVQKYQDFKKEMAACVESNNYEGGYESIFLKYEVTSNSQRGIPVEVKNEYAKEVDEAMKNCSKEIEYMDIMVDKNLDKILEKLTGDDIVALEFMLIEPSSLNIYPDGLVQ